MVVYTRFSSFIYHIRSRVLTILCKESTLICKTRSRDFELVCRTKYWPSMCVQVRNSSYDFPSDNYVVFVLVCLKDQRSYSLIRHRRSRWILRRYWISKCSLVFERSMTNVPPIGSIGFNLVPYSRFPASNFIPLLSSRFSVLLVVVAFVVAALNRNVGASPWRGCKAATTLKPGISRDLSG